MWAPLLEASFDADLATPLLDEAPGAPDALPTNALVQRAPVQQTSLAMTLSQASPITRSKQKDVANACKQRWAERTGKCDAKATGKAAKGKGHKGGKGMGKKGKSAVGNGKAKGKGGKKSLGKSLRRRASRSLQKCEEPQEPPSTHQVPVGRQAQVDKLNEQLKKLEQRRGQEFDAKKKVWLAVSADLKEQLKPFIYRVPQLPGATAVKFLKHARVCRVCCSVPGTFRSPRWYIMPYWSKGNCAVKKGDYRGPQQLHLTGDKNMAKLLQIMNSAASW